MGYLRRSWKKPTSTLATAIILTTVVVLTAAGWIAALITWSVLMTVALGFRVVVERRRRHARDRVERAPESRRPGDV
jgi:hypothetical protein